MILAGISVIDSDAVSCVRPNRRSQLAFDDLFHLLLSQTGILKSSKVQGGIIPSLCKVGQPGRLGSVLCTDESSSVAQVKE